MIEKVTRSCIFEDKHGPEKTKTASQAKRKNRKEYLGGSLDVSKTCDKSAKLNSDLELTPEDFMLASCKDNYGNTNNLNKAYGNEGKKRKSKMKN